MKKSEKVALFLLRVALGWLFLYSGVIKALDPEWTAAGMLNGAQTFSAIYSWFGAESNIVWVNFLNIWGQILIGLGLITGTLTRVASFAGILLMALYYFPGLTFPYVEHGFLVDSHVVYALVFLVLANLRAGQYWGLDAKIQKKAKKSFWV